MAVAVAAQTAHPRPRRTPLEPAALALEAVEEGRPGLEVGGLAGEPSAEIAVQANRVGDPVFPLETGIQLVGGGVGGGVEYQRSSEGRKRRFTR